MILSNEDIIEQIEKLLDKLSHYTLNYKTYNEVRALLDNWEAPSANSKEEAKA